MLYIYMGAAIFYLLSIGGAGWYGMEQGKKIENADCLQKEKARGEEINKGVAKIVKHVKSQDDANRSNLIVALGKGQKENEEINNRYNNLLITHDRLRIKANRATSCNKPVPRENQSASVLDGEITIELPAETDRRIRSVGKDAEQELAKCNQLRDIVRPTVDIIGINDVVKK
jgi:hypothetical protein